MRKALVFASFKTHYPEIYEKREIIRIWKHTQDRIIKILRLIQKDTHIRKPETDKQDLIKMQTGDWILLNSILDKNYRKERLHLHLKLEWQDQTERFWYKII